MQGARRSRHTGPVNPGKELVDRLCSGDQPTARTEPVTIAITKPITESHSAAHDATSYHDRASNHYPTDDDNAPVTVTNGYATTTCVHGSGVVAS